jgi:hypothetical protein
MPAFVARDRMPPTLNGDPDAPFPPVNMARTLRRFPVRRAGSRAAITTARDLPDVARLLVLFFLATVPPLCVGRMLAM